MLETVASPIHDWDSFYVIVGSSAGALTGLQFVVVTLIAESPARDRGQGISAFGTPTIVHFCAALLVAAILSAPWGDLGRPGTAIATAGLLGVLYTAIVIRRARRQRSYQPVFEDWMWHAALPIVAYATILVAALTLAARPAPVLFFIGGAVLLLVFIGIHNAWDTVTYLITANRPAEPEEGDREQQRRTANME